MTLALTEEQELLRSTAADFIDSEVVPHRARWDRDELVDREIVGRLGELGFLGLTLPEELGGTPVDSRSYCLMMEELGRGDSAIRGIVSVSLGLVAKSIAAYGTEDQQKEWVPGLAAGETLACFGLTEPGTGSDAGNLGTRARRDGADWVLSGEKVFITNGTWADVALVFRPTRRGSRPGRSRASSACAARPPRPCTWTRSGCRTPTGWASRARASGSRCPRWTRAG
jgi:alkylation response protein AidB-like acyl-CoA dehydrogenase